MLMTLERNGMMIFFACTNLTHTCSSSSSYSNNKQSIHLIHDTRARIRNLYAGSRKIKQTTTTTKLFFVVVLVPSCVCVCSVIAAAAAFSHILRQHRACSSACQSFFTHEIYIYSVHLVIFALFQPDLHCFTIHSHSMYTYHIGFILYEQKSSVQWKEIANGDSHTYYIVAYMLIRVHRTALSWYCFWVAKILWLKPIFTWSIKLLKWRQHCSRIICCWCFCCCCLN